MNPVRFFLACGLLALAWLSPGAMAQIVQRVIPAQATYGEMVGVDGTQIAIGDRVYRMAPGLLIRGTNNLLVLPETLRGLSGAVKIRYQVDMSGDLFRVWILTGEEIAALNLRPAPTVPPLQLIGPMPAVPAQSSSSSSN